MSSKLVLIFYQTKKLYKKLQNSCTSGFIMIKYKLIIHLVFRCYFQTPRIFSFQLCIDIFKTLLSRTSEIHIHFLLIYKYELGTLGILKNHKLNEYVQIKKVHYLMKNVALINRKYYAIQIILKVIQKHYFVTSIKLSNSVS